MVNPTWRCFGLICAGFLIGCTENSPPPTVADPASNTKPAVANVREETRSPSAPQETAKSPAALTSSEKPLPPEIAPEESPEAADVEPETPFSLEDGFSALSLDDFDAFQAEPDTWSATEDGIHCTGKPKGYLYSHAVYQNFTWRLDYRFARPKSLKDEAKFKGNTGFLVYITGEQKLWPVCLEVQGKHVQMAAIKENGGAAAVTVSDDEAAREAARKPVGQWNRLEIVSKDGALTAKLNDIAISRSEPNFLSDGKIGIQAEDHAFTVRRMRIRSE